MILRKLFFLAVLLFLAIGWGGLSFFNGILPVDLLSGKKNIVVMGCDVRKGDAGRSDTLFVVMMDPDKKGASLLSIPRDTRVQIRGHGWDKINAAFAYGGAKLTRDTVQELLGIRLDNYVEVDFQGFKDLVDVIGGVDINVEKRMYYYDPYADFRIDLRPGLQHMDGKTAIQYVRYRDEEGDIGRIRRQQKFILAIYKQIVSKDIIARIPGVAKQIMSMIKTDLSLKEMADLGRALHGMMERGGLKMAMVPGRPGYIDGISYWVPDIPKMREEMAQMQDVKMSEKFRANTEALEKEYASGMKETEPERKEEIAQKEATEKTGEKTTKKTAVENAEKETTQPVMKSVQSDTAATRIVRLVNCTGKETLGDKAKRRLEQAGFKVIMQGESGERNTTVVLATSTGEPVSAALRKIPFVHVTRSRDIPDAGFDATIMLGKDFR